MPADKSTPTENDAQAAQFVQAGIRAAKSGRNAEARKLLRQALDLDDGNEQAWLWLAAAVESPGERRVCLENVLDINPENAVARRALARVVDEIGTTAQKVNPPASRSRSADVRPRPSPTRAADGSTRAMWALLAAIIVLMLVGGWLLAVQRSLGAIATATMTNYPSATLDFIGQQQTSDAQSLATATALALPYNPTITPLPTLFAVVLSWTPMPSQTPPASITPTTTPLALGALTVLFVGEGRDQKGSGLYTIKADGSMEQLLIHGDTALSDPAWSPDGSHLAYVSTINGSPSLLIANADGTQVRRLMQSGGKYLHTPSWSPDGKQIAYAATNADTGHAALYVIASDGSGVRALTDGHYECHDPAWSPDGSQIIFAADVTNRGNFQLYRLDLQADPLAVDQTAQPRQPTPQPSQALTALTVSSDSNYGPVWSPDGRQIAFVSTRDGHAALYVMAPDGAGQKPLAFDANSDESRDPSWSPDGRRIAFSSNRENGIFAIYVIALDNGQVQRLTDPKNGSAQPCFNPSR